MAMDYSVLALPLPEDISRAKLNGQFELAKKLIDARLSSERTSPMLKSRLELEKISIDRWLKRYPYDRKQALELCKSRIRDFSEDELDRLETDGFVDYIWVGGEKRYLSSFCGSFIKTLPGMAERDLRVKDGKDDGTALKPFIDEIKQKKEVAYRYTVTSKLEIEDKFFTPGETYLCHIPAPAACAQQPVSEITIRADEDAMISKPDALLRSVCYRRTLYENKPFEAEFAFVSRIRYVDPFKDAPRTVYPEVPAPCEDDLSEQLPHIAFTPYLKSLARWIAGDETRPLHLAKRVYDYITLNVRYAFTRSYNLIDCHAEYCALNMKGDCGIQAILFITLCRILGVPARWQSGLTVNRFSTGDHDWAQFYTKEFGWLFADPSYGGGGYRNGDEERRNFYFGNVDPFRMVANRRYMSEFEQPKRFFRFDACDSQDGELEDGAQGFDWDAYDKTDVTKEFIHL